MPYLGAAGSKVKNNTVSVSSENITNLNWFRSVSSFVSVKPLPNVHVILHPRHWCLSYRKGHTG